jgi:MFS family permease
VLLAVGTVMTAIGLNIYVPILSPYAQELGASIVLVGLIGGSYGFVQLLTRIPLGLVSDQWRCTPIVILAPVCAALGCLGLGWSRQPAFFVGWRGLAGLGGAALVAFPSVFIAALGSVRTERATSAFMVSYNFGQMLSSVLGGGLAHQMGWRAPFWAGLLLAVGGTAALGLALASPRCRVEDAAPGAKGVWAVVGDPAILPAFARSAMGTFSMTTLLTFVPVRAAELGAGRSQLGLLVGVTLAAAIAANAMCGSILAGRLGLRWVAAMGLGLLSAGTFILPSIGQWKLLFAAQVSAGLGYGLLMPALLATILDAGAATQRGVLSGAFMWYGAMGTFGGPVVGGLLADTLGLDAAFLALGALSLLATVHLVWSGLRRRRHPDG